MKGRIKNYKTSLIFLLLAITLAVLSLTDQGGNFEETIGLPWYYKIRDVVSPPDAIVIVNIDELSAQMLNLPDDPEKWPRSYYARLIDQLNRQSRRP